MNDDLYYESWGRFPHVSHLGCVVPKDFDNLNIELCRMDKLVLPRGLGRSYGDSCLNGGGYLISTQRLNKVLAFDEVSGIIKCESGVTLEQLLQDFVSEGWFLPVTPGTKFVTIGGAIANDVHGKNHHKAGNFGNHILRFELLRSDGSTILCSKDNNADLFHATIGGLGLTGMILWAEFRLIPVPGPYIEMESIKFKNLDEFTEISRASEQDYEYTVSWLDCLSTGEAMGRGIFMRGNHSEHVARATKVLSSNSRWQTFPFDAPSFLLSHYSIKAFNFLFYNKQLKTQVTKRVYFDPFFYPLDKINHWNRMYGKRGFLQWQCVVPKTDKNEGIKMILAKIVGSGLGSFLAVLKEFGNLPAEGMLSFPMAGVTLALDFANVGNRLFFLLDKLDDYVIELGGRIYPAKDGRMKPATFRASFHEFKKFNKFIDPKFSSSFYRRINED